MQPSFKIQAVVHHGTTLESAQSILRSSAIRPNALGILGDGLYFWDSSLEAAKGWNRSRRYENPAILSGSLAIDPERLLDFFCPKARRDRKNFLDELNGNSELLELTLEKLRRRIDIWPKGKLFSIQGFIVELIAGYKADGLPTVQAVRAIAKTSGVTKSEESSLGYGYSGYAPYKKHLSEKQDRQDNSILEQVAVMWCVRDYDVLGEVRISSNVGSKP